MKKTEHTDEIYFSERYRRVYLHLGVFALWHVRRNNEGIEPGSFISEIGSVIPGAHESIAFLLEHKLIVKKSDGLLYLNKWRFYSMSVWDLLLMAEPWLEQTPPTESERKHEEFKSLCRSEKLHDSYTDLIA